MLVLTRNSNQSIMIGDNITITVLGIKNGQAKIGINAPPREIDVHREEVYQRIHDEKEEGYVGH